MKIVLQFQKKDFKWLKKILLGAGRKLSEDAEAVVQSIMDRMEASKSPEKFFAMVAKVREMVPAQFHAPVMEYLEGLRKKYGEKWAASRQCLRPGCPNPQVSYGLCINHLGT